MQMAKFKQGKHSFSFSDPPVITAWASIAGKKESEGPLAHWFDVTSQDTYFGQNTWEQAEKRMQQMALETLASKSGMTMAEITQERKNEISHRSASLAKLREELKKLNLK